MCLYILHPPPTTATPLTFIHKTDAERSDVWGKDTMIGGSC